MGKSAEEIVSAFVSETKVQLKGNDKKNLLKFAEAIILMENDAKKLIPSLRNCQYYSEQKVAKEFRISHGTFQNDKILHMMANWHLEKKKGGLKADDRIARVKELENALKVQSKQIDGLLARQIKFDSICVECENIKKDLIKQQVRFKRAMDILKQHRLDGLVNLYVSSEDIYAFMYGMSSDSTTDSISNSKLVQDSTEETDVQ